MNKITELQIITSKIDQDIDFIIFKTKLIQSLTTTTRSKLSSQEKLDQIQEVTEEILSKLEGYES